MIEKSDTRCANEQAGILCSECGLPLVYCNCRNGDDSLSAATCSATRRHSESVCERCGRENVTWFAPSDLWNLVARRSDGTDPMLCPVCFIKIAEFKGKIKDAWRVQPEFYK